MCRCRGHATLSSLPPPSTATTRQALPLHPATPTPHTHTHTHLSAQVLQLLLEMKRSSWLLKQTFYSLKTGQTVDELRCRQLQTYRHEFQHFVNIMHGYIASQLFGVSLGRVSGRLEGAFSEARRPHSCTQQVSRESTLQVSLGTTPNTPQLAVCAVKVFAEQESTTSHEPHL